MTAPGETAGHGVAEYRRILDENLRYVEAFDRSALTAAPLSGLAIIACMDARLDVEEAPGLRTGDAHIIRNAGGRAAPRPPPPPTRRQGRPRGPGGIDIRHRR